MGIIGVNFNNITRTTIIHCDQETILYIFLTHILLFISVCFKIFDRDKDGQLNRSEIATMLQSMVEIRNQTLPPSERIRPEGIFYRGKTNSSQKWQFSFCYDSNSG